MADIIFFNSDIFYFLWEVFPIDFLSKMEPQKAWNCFGTILNGWNFGLHWTKFLKFPHSVCHICASQMFIYENLGNYLKNARCCSHRSRGRFRKEKRDFRNLNIAILATPQKWLHIQTLEISIIWLYLDATFSFRPKILGVDAHLYRLLSPQI